MLMKTQLKHTYMFVKTYKILHIYVLILAFYTYILTLFSDTALLWVKLFMIFSDPIMLGLFFVGGVVLIEKQEGVLKSLACSPLTLHQYLISKLVILSLLAVMVAAVLSLVRTNHFNLVMMLGVLLGNVLFTLLGLWLVAKIQTVNQYILYATPLTMFITIPFIMGLVFEVRVLTLNPVHMIYEMIAYSHITPSWPFIIQITVLVFSCFVLYNIVYRSYRRMFHEGRI